MNKEQMLSDMMKQDFLVTDLRLFLDTHPNDAAAMEAFNKEVQTAANLRQQYEKAYGPVTSRCAEVSGENAWTAAGWPWQKTVKE